MSGHGTNGHGASSRRRTGFAGRIAIALLLGTVLAWPSGRASAQDVARHDGPIGLGVIVGEPTGVSLKAWTGGRVAFDAALAWSFADDEALHVHADYLWHFFDRLDVDDLESGRIPLYVGVGGRVKFDENDELLGVRVPLGITFLLRDAPVDFFLEVVPLLDLVPDSEVRMNAALGARYYFD